MATGAKITGLRETVRNLERLGVDVEDIRAAFTAIAADVAQEAGVLAPVGETGALRGSIRPGRAKNKAIVRAGTAARVPYAGVINYGWAARGIAATGFLTTPANRDLDKRVARIDTELGALLRRRNLD